MKIHDPKIWGPPLWDILHYITFRYDETKDEKIYHELFTKHLPNLMPCKSCRDHYKQHIKKLPIRLESRNSLSRWLVHIHNKVNKQLKKKEMPYEIIKSRYCNQTIKHKVTNSFLKWSQIMRPHVVTGPSHIQHSYTIFVSLIFNYD